MSIKSGKRGQALPHSDYIARIGRFGRKPGADHLVAQESGNLPFWAHGSPRTFWRTADRYERLNGAAYREIELALPRELSNEQNIELVKNLVQSVIGEKPTNGLFIPHQRPWRVDRSLMFI
ncbi:MobA/MobL family protein [Ottowia beijingensis]|uniref:MobA/MobL family protein n=1 Tax=Ottowia beijingensis TaxID=1207057 RepID=UPI00214DADE7|nr:MobA/MobL family protein [Ottowia beijingensis]